MPEIFYFMTNIKYLISQTCVVLIITQCLLTHSKDFTTKPLVNLENTLEENNTTKELTLKLYKILDKHIYPSKVKGSGKLVKAVSEIGVITAELTSTTSALRLVNSSSD